MRMVKREINSFKIEMKYVQGSWSDNFKDSINENLENVKSIMQDLETIKSTTENSVHKDEFQRVQDRLDLVVLTETFDEYVKSQKETELVAPSEFRELINTVKNNQKQMDTLLTREELFQKLNVINN